MRVTADHPLFRVGGGGGNRSDADRPTVLALEREVLPTLLWACEAQDELDTDARASAYLALGKTARRPADVRAVLDGASRRDLPDAVHEGAVLALGLLRRSTPADAFDPETLDRARATCLEAYDDASLPSRTRAFAALSLGLLGDQRSAKASVLDRDGRWVVRELWLRVRESHASEELPAALLVALSLQDPRACPSGLLEGLRGLAASGRLEGRSRGSVTRAHAVLAFARLSPDGGTGVLQALLHSRSCDPRVRRSAVVALGTVASRLAPAPRAEAAGALARFAGRGSDPEGRGAMLVSIGRLLAADVAEGESGVVLAAGEALLEGLRDGTATVRPFAALALGIAFRDLDGPRAPDAATAFRERAVEVLRATASDEGVDPSTRGAFCLALGLARDEGAHATLSGIASRRSHPDELRGHACTAIGLAGKATPSAVLVLRGALLERSSEDLRRSAAVGLGLLGDVSAVPLLLEDLASGGSDHVLAQVVLGLGAIGDASAVPSLARVVRDGAATDLLRAIACAGLGLLGDREPVPSLSRLGTDSNTLAVTDALGEALSLL
jgi:HEAT repeat protein